MFAQTGEVFVDVAIDGIHYTNDSVRFSLYGKYCGFLETITLGQSLRFQSGSP